MNTNLLTHKPWLALTLLGLAYSLLGWYLSAHHVFWLVGTVVALITLAAAWKSSPVLESLRWLTSRQLFVVIGVSLLFSLVIALSLTRPLLLSLIVLPLVTLLYALFEMKAASFNQLNVFLWSVTLAGLGLGLGEAVDLFISPSMRY